MKNIERNIINAFLVSRLQSLKYMYQQSEENCKQERKEQLNNDWIEWESLESDSREYVLNYLSKKPSAKED